MSSILCWKIMWVFWGPRWIAIFLSCSFSRFSFPFSFFLSPTLDPSKTREYEHPSSTPFWRWWDRVAFTSSCKPEKIDLKRTRAWVSYMKRRNSPWKDLGQLLQPSSYRPHLDMKRTHFPKEFIWEIEGMFNLNNIFWCFKMVTSRAANPITTIATTITTEWTRSERRGTKGPSLLPGVDFQRMEDEKAQDPSPAKSKVLLCSVEIKSNMQSVLCLTLVPKQSSVCFCSRGNGGLSLWSISVMPHSILGWKYRAPLHVLWKALQSVLSPLSVRVAF